MLFYIQPLLVFHRNYTIEEQMCFLLTISCIKAKSILAKLLEHFSKYLTAQVKTEPLCRNYQTMLDNTEGEDSDCSYTCPQCLVLIF